MTLDDYLYRYRIREQDFADKVGVAQGYINRLRNARQMPSMTTAKKIKEATNGEVTPDDFLTTPTYEPIERVD